MGEGEILFKQAEGLTAIPDGVLLQSAGRLSRHSIRKALREELPSAIREAIEEVGSPAEIAGMIRLIAAKSSDGRDAVLRKALTLYGLAIDALEKGNRMVILNPEDEILHEINGIGLLNTSHEDALI